MFERLKSKNSLTALIYIIAGIVLVVAPTAPVRIICLILGIILLIQGILRIASSGRGYSLVPGILLLIVGVLLVFSPSFIISLLPVAVGVYLLISGISEIMGAMDVRRAGGTWVGTAVVAGIMLLTGVVLLFNPFGSLQMALRIAGVALLIDGISTMFFSSR